MVNLYSTFDRYRQRELTWPSLFRRTLRMTPKDPCPNCCQLTIRAKISRATDLSSPGPRSCLPQTYWDVICLFVCDERRNTTAIENQYKAQSPLVIDRKQEV